MKDGAVSEERIELVGGPLDGKVLAWPGGNVLRVAEISGVSIKEPEAADPPPLARDREYVRSASVPHRFIYQGD